MKKVLLATSALVMTAGFAAAEVTLSGDARMGIIDNFGSGDDVAFTSRARVTFTLSGESDSGFSFGASFRADNASGAASGTAGSVFVSGAFGKLSMGDVDGAALAAVGHVDGVGLTGLGDLNESAYIANGGSDLDNGGANDTFDPSALYEYSAGDLTVYASITNPSSFDVDAYALGVAYKAGNFKVALGYETTDGFEDFPADNRDLDHVIVGVDGTFGAITAKVRYGSLSGNSAGVDVDGDQAGVSLTYNADPLSATIFWNDKEELGGSEAYGLGASYDLGGGASVVGGYVKDKTNDTNAFDLGLSFKF